MMATGPIQEEDAISAIELYRMECDAAGDTHPARRESLALIMSAIGDMLQVVTATVS